LYIEQRPWPIDFAFPLSQKSPRNRYLTSLRAIENGTVPRAVFLIIKPNHLYPSYPLISANQNSAVERYLSPVSGRRITTCFPAFSGRWASWTPAAKAAESLYISQPALTKSLRELETELGISIFSRSKKGIQLTNDGIEFIRYARQVYQQYELLENKYAKKGETKQKFGVSTQHYSFVDKAFVETVRQFGSQDYEFSIRETKTFSVIRNVARSRSLPTDVSVFPGCSIT
jgi:sulfur relay (sulfurtransferase) DsrC/TusE family protein